MIFSDFSGAKNKESYGSSRRAAGTLDVTGKHDIMGAPTETLIIWFDIPEFSVA